MNELSEEIGRICNILEDAIEEKDWDLIKQVLDDLNNVYTDLDKQDSGFDYDYD